jgi:FAD:protein FMN transferase
LTGSLTRRRFIGISAAALGFGLTVRDAAANPSSIRRWRGVALGADAELTLHHPDPNQAEKIINVCLAEVRRLEKIFSLYHPSSALTQLNTNSRLAAPPHELVDLLSRARSFSESTDGAFDVTVQPLWQLYAEHFSNPGAKPAGPSIEALEQARVRIGIHGLHIDAQEITFANPGMAVTLNGIAQGYITDRVADVLRGFGMMDVLVNMGETRALGGHPDDRPWRIGLEKSPSREINLRDAAIATSGGYGFIFGPDTGQHHILDPRTGVSPARWQQVSVIADDATTADALSTASMMLTGDQVAGLSRQYNVKIITLDNRREENIFERS